MAEKVRQAVNKYLCRNRERNPILQSDRRRAAVLRGVDQAAGEAPPHTPTLADSHEPSKSSMPQATRYRVVYGDGSRSTRTPRGDDDDDDDDDEVDVDVEDDDDDDDDEGIEYMETDVVIKRAKKTGRFASQPRGDGDGDGASGSGVQRKGKGKKRKDESWVIREPCPGGPVDPSVIPSFGGHVARSLWDNPAARGTILCYNRPLKVAELATMQLPMVVRNSLLGSGLSHLLGCTFEHLNMNLISAFVERWQPDTNTFHMPFGEISILLHDVQYLLGLPIEGDVCGPTLDAYGHAISPMLDVCSLFGRVEKNLLLPYKGGVPLYKNGGVLVEAVRDVVLNGDPEDSVKAYLALLVGSTLFLDKSSDRIRPHVFPMVSDMSEVGNYAWGVGALAYLYRQLGQASRAGAKGISGCLPLLEAWIYTYFPTFRPGSPAPLQQGEPGIKAWRGGPKHTADASVLRSLRDRLDTLTAHSVRWVPPTLPGFTHPSSLFSGCIRFMEIVEPYQPDRCLRQFGYVQAIPTPMPFGDYYRPSSGIGYRVEVGLYADHPWNTREDHGVHLDSRSVPAHTFVEMTDDYWEWYKRISHRFISDPEDREQLIVEDDLDAGSQLGLALANSVAPLLQMTTSRGILQYVQTHRAQIGELVNMVRGHCARGGSRGRVSRGGRRSGGRQGGGRRGGASMVSEIEGSATETDDLY